MKKDFGPQTWLFPMPVLMIGTYNENGTPNVMNAAWGGCTLENEITICIDNSHKTWTNLIKNRAFTIAVATQNTVKECDYLGIVSGNIDSNKVTKCGFTTKKSNFVDAPIICELPFVLECEVKSADEDSCRVIGKIVNIACDESILTDDKIDITKLQPICFNPCAHTYHTIGTEIAKAFSCGKIFK